MKSIKEMIEVMKWFDEEPNRIVVCKQNGAEWPTRNPLWDWWNVDYSIPKQVDPYAELKAAAIDPTKEIRFFDSTFGWGPWYSRLPAPGAWQFDQPVECYEIRDVIDPYAELKAAAKDPTKQIRFKTTDGWGHWVNGGTPLALGFTFTHPIENYEVRDELKDMNLFAYIDPIDGDILWRHADYKWKGMDRWVRVPSEDKFIEM